MAVKRLTDLDIRGKRVLIREDLNVPVSDGHVTSDARIVAAIPTIKYALKAGAKLMVMSHLGRPEEGVSVTSQPSLSMAPVAKRIEELAGIKVRLVSDYLEGVEWSNDSSPEELVLFENIRINKGEKQNDPDLARRLAVLCDIFVMDAFGTAHRAQASTEGVARYAAIACAGPLLMSELEALGQALEQPQKPIVAIVGGAKVSSKLEVLDALSDKVDSLIVGGGIANTFLAASGVNIGRSLVELDLLETARRLLGKVKIPMPTDVVVATEMSASAIATIKPVSDIDDLDMILDVGPDTSQMMSEIVSGAATIIWNGPLGVFEFEQFSEGTRRLAKDIAANQGFSLAGGGDTLAAIDQFGIREQISYISTGGGAFLEFVEGKKLPAVVVLEERG
jgi:phosphoglycerate kinase